MRTTIEKAVATLERMKETHIQWIKYYRDFPDQEQKEGLFIGNTQHHQDIINEYNEIIELLRSLNEQIH